MDSFDNEQNLLSLDSLSKEMKENKIEEVAVLLKRANLLEQWKQQKLHKQFGYERWVDFLADPDIGIEMSQARKLLKLKVLVQVLEQNEEDIAGFLSLGGKRVMMIVDCCQIDWDGLKNVEAIKELISQGNELSFSDFLVETVNYRQKHGENKDVPVLFEEGAVQNREGDMVGYLGRCSATKDAQYITIRVENRIARIKPLEMVVK